jgi:hypothetical protein
MALERSFFEERKIYVNLAHCICFSLNPTCGVSSCAPSLPEMWLLPTPYFSSYTRAPPVRGLSPFLLLRFTNTRSIRTKGQIQSPSPIFLSFARFFSDTEGENGAQENSTGRPLIIHQSRACKEENIVKSLFCRMVLHNALASKVKGARPKFN